MRSLNGGKISSIIARLWPSKDQWLRASSGESMSRIIDLRWANEVLLSPGAKWPPLVRASAALASPVGSSKWSLANRWCSRAQLVPVPATRRQQLYAGCSPSPGTRPTPAPRANSSPSAPLPASNDRLKRVSSASH